ncbi:MAG: hypothetical protein ACRC5C_06755, partial [Bacilli bacterium]
QERSGETTQADTYTYNAIEAKTPEQRFQDFFTDVTGFVWEEQHAIVLNNVMKQMNGGENE